MTAPAASLLSQHNVWAGPAALAAAGELVADKLPFIPARTSPPALAVRVLAGALCGRALAQRREAPALLGVTCGALGALAGSYGGYRARMYLTTARGWPALPVALGEDVLTLVLARVATA